jgi:hypothetical protein
MFASFYYNNNASFKKYSAETDVATKLPSNDVSDVI